MSKTVDDVRLWHVNRCLWMADKIMAQELIDLQDSKNVVARPVTFDEIAAKRLELNRMMEAGLIKRGMD